MSAPRKGDRVRVTYEAEWAAPTQVGRYTRRENGYLTVPEDATVEVIEPADDPSKDLVGTVRAWADGPYVRSDRDPYWPWVPVHRDGGNDHRSMTGTKIIGVVPGSPAAEADR
jgi:hypothetical protein